MRAVKSGNALIAGGAAAVWMSVRVVGSDTLSLLFAKSSWGGELGSFIGVF